MANHKKLWALLILGLAIAAIVLLTGGLSGLQLGPGHPFSWGVGTPGAISNESSSAQNPELSPFLRVIITLVVWVLLPLSIIYFIISPAARKRVLRDAVAILSMILIIYLFTRAFRQLGLFPQGIAPQAAGPSAPAADLPAPAEYVSHPPPWLVFTASLALVVIVSAAIWFLWPRRFRSESPLQRLAQEAQQALEDLRTGADLKDTVMRCYLEMSRVFSERRDIRRRRAMTPREFEEHLGAAGVRDEHIRRLTRLFEAVRYGGKKIDAREEAEAQACLEAIVVTYGRVAS